MSHKLQPVRGTHDILPDEFEQFSEIVAHARELATLYGFREMSTPIFESTSVFSRSMGETSDVVSKEMFTFETKGEESVTLRPEFTAGIVRSFLSNGMQQHLPLKLFSAGPVFRYERPQKGRQRQFHQVNFEWLGDASPQVDIELICLAGHILHILSGGKQKCKLLINTLGDVESRTKYRDALVKYLSPYAKELSEDSQRRLIKNPLRILDSKSPQDKEIIAGAPHITQYLNDASRERFNVVCETLCEKKILFVQKVDITPSLVRGLDYYSDTVFEFVAEEGELGAQNTVLAGGRYDGLVEQMGGKPTPAIGFAAGVERLQLLAGGKRAPHRREDIHAVFMPLEGVQFRVAHVLVENLRIQFYRYFSTNHLKQNCIVEADWHGSLKKRMERASKAGATHVIILAPDELQRGNFKLKYMKTGDQLEATLDDFMNQEKIISLFTNDKSL